MQRAVAVFICAIVVATFPAPSMDSFDSIGEKDKKKHTKCLFSFPFWRVDEKTAARMSMMHDGPASTNNGSCFQSVDSFIRYRHLSLALTVVYTIDERQQGISVGKRFIKDTQQNKTTTFPYKMKTRITSMLKCRYPVILPGMSWISTPELVAAVSNAGGVGILATGPVH